MLIKLYRISVTGAALAAIAVLVGCIISPERNKARHAEPERETPVLRLQYNGLQPEIQGFSAIPVLPFYFCEAANKWTYTYPANGRVQIYATGPDTSYREYMEDVVDRRQFPWALGTYVEEELFVYFINIDPHRGPRFDYVLHAAAFDTCAELAVTDRVSLVSCSQLRTHRGPAALAIPCRAW